MASEGRSAREWPSSWANSGPQRVSRRLRWYCPVAWYPGRVGLVDDFAVFLAEHRRCGLLDGGEWVRVRCECGAEMLRRADED